MKRLFCKRENVNGIFNWLLDGYRWLREDVKQGNGLVLPDKVKDAIAEYRQETDIVGQFVSDCTARHENNRIAASELYAAYTSWAKDNGYRQLNNKNFIAELRRQADVRRGAAGNVVVGVSLVRGEKCSGITE